MKSLLAVILAFAASDAFAALECTAVSRSTDGKRIETKALPSVFKSTQVEKWETEIGLHHFSVTQHLDTDEYVLMITRGPAYMDGAALRAAMPKSGEIRASFVAPEETQRLICRLL